MHPLNILVLTPYLYDTVPGQRFRIEQWARAWEPQGVRCRFVPFETPALKQVLYQPHHVGRKLHEVSLCLRRRLSDVLRLRREWDLAYLYRELLPIGPPMLEAFLARRGMPLVYDFDDAIYLPAVSQANRAFRWLKYPQKTGAICRLSAHVIVGNATLAGYVRRYTSRVSVIPTTIDTEWYQAKPSAEPHDLPIIGWSGSLTTVEHLKTIESALRILFQQHAFRLNVIGSSNPPVDGMPVESKPWNRESELDDLRTFDIGIMPLPDDAWARGKCGLKALQYMALGIPTVASPVGINTEIIQDGVNGFLAGTTQEWVEKLSRLLTDHALRHQFAQAGRRTVEAWYAAKVQAPRVLKIFEQVCGRQALNPQEEPLVVG